MPEWLLVPAFAAFMVIARWLLRKYLGRKHACDSEHVPPSEQARGEGSEGEW